MLPTTQQRPADDALRQGFLARRAGDLAAATCMPGCHWQAAARVVGRCRRQRLAKCRRLFAKFSRHLRRRTWATVCRPCS